MDNLNYVNRSAAAGLEARYDEGLRRHMLGIYRNMGIGLAITGLVAIAVASTPALVALIFGILILILPRLLNYLIAVYLILIGLVGLFPHLFTQAT